MLRSGRSPLDKKWIYMKMSKFVHFRAQRDLNGAEITVTITTERHKYTWPSTIWQQKTSPAAIMRPERAPRRAKIDPQNSQRVPKLPPGDKQCNFNDFRKLFGLFLEPFWVPSGHTEARNGAQASKNGFQKQPRGAKMTTWRQTLESWWFSETFWSHLGAVLAPKLEEN